MLTVFVNVTGKRKILVLNSLTSLAGVLHSTLEAPGGSCGDLVNEAVSESLNLSVNMLVAAERALVSGVSAVYTGRLGYKLLIAVGKLIDGLGIENLVAECADGLLLAGIIAGRCNGNDLGGICMVAEDDVHHLRFCRLR